MRSHATWRCPVCRADLVPSATEWRCGNGHGFDVAREGYVNLLITHQRRKREPGDSAEMLRARREFLDGGWYEPVRAAVADHAAPAADTAVCDAGCGEGYYTRGWPQVWAVDIAKAAVRMAAKRAAAGNHYAVASVYDLPLADASVDVLVSVFAPLPAAEYERVVKPGGRVVTATPGPRHLEGLAAQLFAEVEPHPDEGPFERDGATTALTATRRDRVRFDLDLDRSGAIGALLGMTPYAWYVDQETRDRVARLSRLVTPVEVLVTTYSR